MMKLVVLGNASVEISFCIIMKLVATANENVEIEKNLFCNETRYVSLHLQCVCFVMTVL